MTTDYSFTKQTIDAERFVIIMRGVPKEKIGYCAEAIVKAGVKLAEVTFLQDHPDPLTEYGECIERIRRAVGNELLLGCGTCLTVPQLYAAYNAGARFVIAPNANPEIIRNTKRLGLVSIPGAFTPTEVVAAYDAGADYVKLFPGLILGYKYLSELNGPLPHIPLLIAGGATTETIPEMMRRGAYAFGTGLIVNKDRVERDAYKEIEEVARAHVELIHGILAEKEKER